MTADSIWTPPPADLRLAEGDLHVWRANLLHPSIQVQLLSTMLGPEERDRASRLRFERDRRRFIAAHGALRQILGSYVGHDPAELRFHKDPGGKPALAGMTGSLLRFNLSHSQDLALIALALRREVGVDVEQIRDVDLALARHCFSPAEIEALQSLPEADQRAAFFTCWTRKEAYIKATGSGLSMPLDSFAVSLCEPAALLHPSDTSWTLHTLHPAPGYAAAVAVDGEVAQIHCWDYAV